MKYFNKLAHLGIGFTVGCRSDKPDAMMITAAFLGYQAIEVASKGDRGYPEVKEFGVGLGLGLLVKRLWRVPWYRVEIPRHTGSEACCRDCRVNGFADGVKAERARLLRGE